MPCEGSIMVNSSLVLKKIAHVRHNLSRVKEKSKISLEALENDLDTQDIILHNLQLTIQGCIDIGAHIIADEGWGVAGSVNETFYTLNDKGVLSLALREKMVSMVGFRNIIVHEYEEISLEIVHNITQKHLSDIDEFLLTVVRHFNLG
jgi:uncharacterized protein YutE (UPF0331/DUF86 family)